MKIEKISDNKIKVMISESEAKEWNVSFKNISENTKEVREMFWTAIQMAEKDVDFYVDDGAKLVVEAVPGAQEGFGMLITRVASEEELNAAISSCSYKGRLRQTELKFPKKKGGRRYLYRFPDFEVLCAAAGELARLYWGPSALYKCGEAFYLCLEPEHGALVLDMEAVLLEFGSRVRNTQFAMGWLNEYGTLMIANQAMEVIQEYFCIR